MLDIVFLVFGFFIISFGFVVFFGAPYVPTLKDQVKEIMKIYPLDRKDVFVDVGSGDGVVLRAVSKKVSSAVGYELSPYLWLISRILSRKQANVTIYFGSFWRQQFPSDTTVVYTFLNGKFMPRLEQKLQAHVDMHGRKISFITYGFKIKGRKILKTEGPMFLYEFRPTLQT